MAYVLKYLELNSKGKKHPKTFEIGNDLAQAEREYEGMLSKVNSPNQTVFELGLWEVDEYRRQIKPGPALNDRWYPEADVPSPDELSDWLDRVLAMDKPNLIASYMRQFSSDDVRGRSSLELRREIIVSHLIMLGVI